MTTMMNALKPLIKEIVKFFYYLPWNFYNKAFFLFKGVKCGKGFESQGSIFVSNKGKIDIADNVRINSSPTSNPIGVGTRMYFQVLKDGMVSIGSGTRISNSAITCSERVQIGKNVRIGAGCKIYDTDFHSLNYIARTTSPEQCATVKHKPVVIEDYAFIGAGSYILKGSKVGFASVIGAGSVVCGVVPPFTIWAGNPAKFIRELRTDEREKQPSDAQGK